MVAHGDRMVGSGETSAKASGDALLDRLWREHAAAVYAFVVRRVGRDGAPDLVAETFAIACRQTGEVSVAWLFGVARRLVLREWDRRGRGDVMVQLLGHQSDLGGVEDPEVSERLAAVYAFGALGEGDREVLMLVGWDRLSPAEAARVLGCTVGAFYVRLHRARRRLQDLFDHPRGTLRGGGDDASR